MNASLHNVGSDADRASFWRGKRVFLTGHTGFKGSWLSLWLHVLGARVYGYALDPLTEQDIYCAIGGDSFINSVIAPIEDRAGLAAAMREADPDVVIHMAAQPLVRLSYEQPIETMMTNVIGTAHVLDALRGLDRARAALVVTSDKCYENRETQRPYREEDAMGGHDPYSMSKGAAELVVSSFRNSYFNGSSCGVASARSGNIFGGGDWSANRIIPDFFRAISDGSSLRIRNPEAIRPWLFVLDSLNGYLQLAERLYAESGTGAADYAQGWNFGPDDDSIKTVRELVGNFEKAVGRPPVVEMDEGPHPHEAGILKLDSTKARQGLGWKPRLNFEEGVAATADWYSAALDGRDMKPVSIAQIERYMEAATAEAAA